MPDRPTSPLTREEATQSLKWIVKSSTGVIIKDEVAAEIMRRIVEPIYDAAVAEGRRQVIEGSDHR